MRISHGKVFRICTVRYNWPMSAHASQAFSIAHCADSEDLSSDKNQKFSTLLCLRLQRLVYGCATTTRTIIVILHNVGRHNGRHSLPTVWMWVVILVTHYVVGHCALERRTERMTSAKNMAWVAGRQLDRVL